MYIHRFGHDAFGNWLRMEAYTFECQAIAAKNIYGGIIQYYEAVK